MLTACADNKVRLWDLASGSEVKNAQHQAAHGALVDAGHNPVWSAVFSPDGTYIATAGGNDATLSRADNGREIMTYSPHGAVAAGAFSPDGRHVATCSWDGTIKVWDAATGNVEVKIVASPEKYVNSVMYSPDGTQLLSASDDNTAKIWDAKTGKLLLSLRRTMVRKGMRRRFTRRNTRPTGCVSSRPRATRPRAFGTPRRARRRPFSRGTNGPLTPPLFRPTANASLPAAKTTRSASGTPPPVSS